MGILFIMEGNQPYHALVIGFLLFCKRLERDLLQLSVLCLQNQQYISITFWNL
jgi:hypothetical protein